MPEAPTTIRPDGTTGSPSGKGPKDRLAAALGSVKLRITLASIVALALGIGFITLLVVGRAERDLLGDQQQRELGESVRTAEILSRRIVSLQRALQAAAHQMETMDLREDAEVFRFLESKQVLRSLFNGIFTISPQQRMRLLIDEKGARTFDLDVSQRAYVQRIFATKQPVISEPVQSKATGEWIVIFAMPVRGDHELRMVLAGSIRLARRDLLDDLTEQVESDEDALMMVSDGSGRILAPSRHVNEMRMIAGEPRFSAAFADWVQAGSSPEPAGLQLPQSSELVTVAGVAGTDWLIWRARSKSELLQPLNDARKDALAWASGLVAIFSVVLLWLLWRLLTPLTQLERRAAHAVDQAMAPAEGWPECGGELGRLAEVLKDGAIARERLEVDKQHLVRLLGSVLDSAPIGLAFVRDGRFELMSNEFCRLLGHEKSELLNQSVRDVFARSPAAGDLAARSEATQGVCGEWPLQRADGTDFWGQIRRSPLDPSDPPAGAIWTLTDVTSQHDARQQLEWAATHDGLTGLPNRKLFERRAARLIAALPESMPAAIVFMDLDRFKPINDTEGHAAGDAVLTAIGGVLSAAIRPGDVAARIGGDEFALLLERCAPQDAMRVADKVCDQVAALEVPWEGRMLRVGASAGVAELATAIDDVAQWLDEADHACYAAKAAGRGIARSAARVA
jgi:diguanylate cyclase (GGDEF)-like protein/PAS domain S-box-containing protein